jgi:predicted nucleic acid-binding protein
LANILSTLILVDASPLISFLKLARFDLLKIVNQPLACTDFVQAEVKRPKEQFETLLATGEIKQIPLVDPYHLLEVEQLYAKGLGRGEASSIILAQQYSYGLIMDDNHARKAAVERGIALYSTTEIVVWNIKAGIITLSEADVFIATWRSLGEFPVSCKTFRDLVS